MSECFEIGLNVHAFFGGSDVCEWICLFIDVCVLCLSHSSGLVRPVCKHVCTERQQACRNERVTEMQREAKERDAEASDL